MGFFVRPRGHLSARMHGVITILNRRAFDASMAAIQADVNGEPYFAASLRGKARAYREAAEMVDALDKGRALPKRRRTP